ncbi:putative ATPase/DNA-binding CsgD family transcriptional regulator [Spinactinospora alkalitolerans]|uniref:Putative ATPase/DNA-binding CsgD family transcriptional regulator n=1 Tax=Spinactinospora alkalitolerans TaxID=687207 RepID=A0A852TQ57_9ACTN|nr:tetratricopeptide repeat protein [Spinactinospora alkalitolerans]NYE46098.1 putative ATPase/DNA-binding CsgD family transcriptional regulator [Spinactinospora alkalitolerans]
MASHTAPARQNLPLETDGFIGRERDVSDLLRLLDVNRLVTLCGVGGIGKTRLALRVATHATGSFPDGVWLAELADVRTRDEVVSRIASAVGVREETGREPGATLQDALRPRRLLLVLDNCEHVIDDVAAVSRSVLDFCPSVSLLLTSREPVRIGGESVWRVPPLSLPQRHGDADPGESEAVRLFVERARSCAPDFAVTPERLRTVAGICRRLDGIPLGIELAAARVRLLSLPQIADRLSDRFRFLTSGDRGAPARQRTLRAVIDWSHALLSDAERVLLRRLSVFSGWNLELAEQVCCDELLPKVDVLDLITSLVDRSLVTVVGEQRGRVRYRLLDTIRHYAAERLAEAGEEVALRTRHREQMLRIAEDLADDVGHRTGLPWSQRLLLWQQAVAEYDNLRASLNWSVSRDDVEEGLRLCVAMRPFWMANGHFAEGICWTDRLLAMDGASGVGEALRGRAMVRRAELAWEQPDHARAREIGEEGLRLCREAGDDPSVALALNTLAMIDVRGRRYDRARRRLAEVTELTRGIGDRWNEGIARGILGALAAREGSLDAADAHYEAAMAILRDSDHRWGVGRTLIGRGTVAEARGDLLDADRYFREALDILRGVGASPELARCLAGVGRVAARQGATRQAYDYLSESLLMSHGTGQRMGVARCLSAIAGVAAGQGLAEEAHRIAGAAAAIRERAGFPPSASARPAVAEESAVDSRTLDSRWEQGRGLSVEESVAAALHLIDAGRVLPPPPVGADTAAERTAPPSLTPREHEIALLIGDGMGNRAIAEALFISPVTVARHVANIHTKLGFNSRTQIAAWISEHTVRS